MTLLLILKILGWILIAVPIGAYIFVSASLIIGASKDDGDVRMLTMLFVTCFGIGGLILMLTYLTNVLL